MNQPGAGPPDDPFELLGLAPSLQIAPAEVESAWRNRAKASHPDRPSPPPGPADSVSPSPDHAAALHRARETLANPAARLEAWLRRHGVAPERSAAIDPGLMDAFARTNNAVSRADAVLARTRQAGSALAKALLAKETAAIQLSLQESMGDLRKKSQALEAVFPDLEAAAEAGDFTQALTTLASLKFLTKWQTSCQEKLLALLSD